MPISNTPGSTPSGSVEYDYDGETLYDYLR